MLYLVSLGIHDEKDLSLRGLEVLRKVSKVYIEFYTSPLKVNLENLEKLIGKKIEILRRKDLEEESYKLIEEAKKMDIAIIVGGDALTATTHLSLILDAEKEKVKYKIIHSSSIFSSICETGISIYKMGRIVSIPLIRNNYNPESFFDYIIENLERGLHTLVLLEQNEYGVVTIKEAIERILEIAKKRKINRDFKFLAISSLGNNAIIKYGGGEIKNFNYNEPPSCLIVLAKLNFIEEEALKRFKS